MLLSILLNLFDKSLQELTTHVRSYMLVLMNRSFTIQNMWVPTKRL